MSAGRPPGALAAGAALVAGATVLLLSPGGGTQGARAAEELQRSATSITPPVEQAGRDRGKLFHRGCMVAQTEMRYPRCVFGKRRSRKTVVLLGDSQAMQHFPALLRVARRNGWRLIGRIRAGCPPAAVHFAFRCDRWRKETLRRIERYDKPDLVVTGSGVIYGVVEGGRRLGTKASKRLLRKGYLRTLRRLRRTGARVAVLKSQPWAPIDVKDCVERSMRRLRRCAFARGQPTNAAFDRRAAKLVRGARLLDPTPRLCLTRICPAVIDDVLVYRDPKHLTATYARTLADWMERKLPKL